MLFLSLIYACPFYSDQYLSYGDTFFHMNRIEGMKESLMAGDFPVRIHGYQLNGYGTADGVMYPSLFLYFPALLRILGLSIAVSWNIFWVFLIIFGLFMSFLGFTIWTQNIRSGAICAAFYHATEVGFFCIGHAVGDYPAFFALPLVIGALIKILESEKFNHYWYFCVIGFTIVFQSHIITTVITSILISGILVLNYKALLNRIQRIAVLKSALFATLLNIWFAIPFVYFYTTCAFHINNPRPVTTLHQVVSSFSEILISQCYLGLPLLLLLFIVLFINRKCKPFIIAVTLYMFLLFADSEHFPWLFIEENLPGGSFFPNFQFPLRFVPFGVVFIMYYLGSFVAEKVKTVYLIAGLTFLIYTLSIYCRAELPIYFGHNVIPKASYKVMDNLPSHTNDHIWLQEDYLYADVDFYKLRNKDGDYLNANDYNGAAEIFEAKKQGTAVEFSYVAKNDTKIQAPLFYYDGYVAKDSNGNKLDVTSGEHRLLEVSVKKGEGRVFISYAGLSVFRFFDVVSLVALIIFCYTIKRERRCIL